MAHSLPLRYCMTIRITATGEDEKQVLQIDGWLRGEDVMELERLVTEVPETGLVLDLSDLRAADKLGIEVLRSFVHRGIELRRVPPIIALQLDSG